MWGIFLLKIYNKVTEVYDITGPFMDTTSHSGFVASRGERRGWLSCGAVGRVCSRAIQNTPALPPTAKALPRKRPALGTQNMGQAPGRGLQCTLSSFHLPHSHEVNIIITSILKKGKSEPEKLSNLPKYTNNK